MSVDLLDSNEVKIGIGDRSEEVNELNVSHKFDIVVTEEVIWNCSVKKVVN